LSYHAQHIPRKVFYYADPSGANEQIELRVADFKVVPGNNSVRPGIAAVRARIEDGTLRIVQGRCPNLLYEAELYRYSDEPGQRYAEVPVDEHNHALAALRYLICGIDQRRMARPRPTNADPGPSPTRSETPAPTPARPKLSTTLRFHYDYWTGRMEVIEE
jgi:hypothetical protein